jgi:TRAP-type C4-dicarboxylate transport system substrate-binding protein
MKKNIAFLLTFFLFFFFTAGSVFAQRGSRAQEVIDVRLASPLPRNSDWGRQLERLAAEWMRVTDNLLRVRVIHDGLEGSETKMFSSLNTNNIQAALFISTGLSEVCPAILTLSVPFLIKSNDELDLVLRDTLPVLDRQMNSTNYVPVAWAKGGWVYFFSREPVYTPDDLRRQRLGTSDGSRDINAMFRQMGFNAVETSVVDIGTKLASNTVNATYLLPEAIVPLGLHRNLPNMLDIPIAPFIGAVIMNRVTWNKLTQQQQRDIQVVTQRIVSEFEASMIRSSANAITAMQRDGLRVNRPTQAQEEQWRAEVDKAIPMFMGTTYDRALYNQINQILERARSR